MTRWNYDDEIRRRVVERLRTAPAWTRELCSDLHVARTIIADVLVEMKAEGLIYRPERALEDGGVTFDRWRLGS
jgi:predicted transcriptional regulator